MKTARIDRKKTSRKRQAGLKSRTRGQGNRTHHSRTAAGRRAKRLKINAAPPKALARKISKQKTRPVNCLHLTKHRTFNDYDDALRSAGSTFQIDHFLDERIATGVPLKWAEAGCGLGICLSLAYRECPEMIEGYGIDLVEWSANNISDKERKGLAKAYGQHTDALLQNPGFTFIQGDLKTVMLPKPVDLITSFFVLQYHDDPLGAWCHLFNQLAPNGVIAAHLLIPANDQALFRFYQRAMKELQGQGVDARFSYYAGRRCREFNVFLVATRRAEELEFLLEVAKVRETTMQAPIPFRIKRVSYRAANGNSSRLNCWRVRRYGVPASAGQTTPRG